MTRCCMGARRPVGVLGLLAASLALLATLACLPATCHAAAKAKAAPSPKGKASPASAKSPPPAASSSTTPSPAAATCPTTYSYCTCPAQTAPASAGGSSWQLEPLFYLTYPNSQSCTAYSGQQPWAVPQVGALTDIVPKGALLYGSNAYVNGNSFPIPSNLLSENGWTYVSVSPYDGSIYFGYNYVPACNKNGMSYSGGQLAVWKMDRAGASASVVFGWDSLNCKPGLQGPSGSNTLSASSSPGLGTLVDMDMAADGSLYLLAHAYQGNAYGPIIYKLDPTGKTLAKVFASSDNTLLSNGHLAVGGPSGSDVYISTHYNVWKVTGLATYKLVAGRAGSNSPPNPGAIGDGVPATQALMDSVVDLALTPNGNLYIATSSSTGGGLVRVLGTDGVLRTALGNFGSRDTTTSVNLGTAELSAAAVASGKGYLTNDEIPSRVSLASTNYGILLAQPDNSVLVAPGGNCAGIMRMVPA